MPNKNEPPKHDLYRDLFIKNNAHVDVIGSTGTGKTFAMSEPIQRNINANNVTVVADYKHGMYEQAVAYIARFRPNYRATFLNPSRPDRVLPFNPFLLQKGRNLSAHASRLTETLLSVISGEQIADLQTFRRTSNAFIGYVAVSGEPVHSAMRLLEFRNREMWAEAASKMPDPALRASMMRISRLTDKEWQRDFLSISNRFDPFFTSDTLRRFMGTGKPGLSVGECRRTRTSIFADFTPSPNLSPEDSRIFAGFLASDILQSAIEDSQKPIFQLNFFDEVQEYAPPNLASLLNLSLGSGMRFILIHHYAGQLDERTMMAVEKNAPSKLVFGGSSPDERVQLARFAYPFDLARRVKKQDRITYVNEYREESTSDYSSGGSWSISETPDGEEITSDSGSYSVRGGSRLRPIPTPVVIGQDDYTPEEKLAEISNRFIVPDRMCTVITPKLATYQYRVPTVRRYLYNSPVSLEFRQSRPNTLSPHDADILANNYFEQPKEKRPTPKKPPHPRPER